MTIQNRCFYKNKTIPPRVEVKGIDIHLVFYRYEKYSILKIL